MSVEKSLFFYGRPYHLVIDRMLGGARRQVLARVPNGSKVLDVACGTGELALALRKEKDCRVLGIDLSRRMIDFARRRNPYDEVAFELMDAAEGLRGFDEHFFDIAVICQLLHEVPADTEVDILRGVTRVAGETLLLDYRSPLPILGTGAIPRLIEGTIGRDHRANFLAFIASGGLPAVLERARLTAHVVERSSYAEGSGELVVLSSVGLREKG